MVCALCKKLRRLWEKEMQHAQFDNETTKVYNTNFRCFPTALVLSFPVESPVLTFFSGGF